LGSGQLSYPSGVAVDGSGNVYVTDANSSRILKFASNGDSITQWATSWLPGCVAVGGSGHVYTSAVGGGRLNNDHVQKFTSTGTFVTEWGTTGTGNGQFADMGGSGIAVTASGDTVYVADSDNNRVQKFTSSGAYVTQWGTQGSGNRQFDRPGGVAVDASGNVYVVDTGNHRIQKFTSTGTYLTQWAAPVADVPPTAASLTFALDPVRPNPSRSGSLAVHFSLPTDAPARLELLDVAGRRVAARDVGMGQHTLDLGAGQRLAPGLYLVRLTQGANTRTTRVAVLK
jgi:DNA-binding beta-propeller fold protein YncE